MCLGLSSVYAHEVNGQDRDIMNTFYQQILNYSQSYSHIVKFNGEPVSQIEMNIWGHKIPLNSQFYELLRISLRSVSLTYNEFCESCIYAEVKERASDKKFVEVIEDKIDDMTELRALISSVKKEYGYMALVGYVIMEMLEHTILGPLGVCPILNAVYFSSLDTFKTMGQVFKYSRDFEFLSMPSLYNSVRSGIKLTLLKKRASSVLLSFDSQSRSVCETSTYSNVHYKHLEKKMKKMFFWQNETIDHFRIKYSEYKKISKKQKRLKWLYWQTNLQKLFSRKLMWPMAYQELILNPYLESSFEVGHFKDDENSLYLNELDLGKDLDLIFNHEVNINHRLLIAAIMSEYMHIVHKIMKSILQQELEMHIITRREYLNGNKIVVDINLLQTEFSNYLIAASLSNNEKNLDMALERAKISLNSFLELFKIISSWLHLSKNYESKSDNYVLIRESVFEELESWLSEIRLHRPWRKKKISWINKISSCLKALQ